MALANTTLTPNKTYKTVANMERALKDIPDYVEGSHYKGAVSYYTAWTEDGRCYPIFMGNPALWGLRLFERGFICVSH